MRNHAINVIAASALSVIPDTFGFKTASYATWATTREEDDFDAARIIDYLKREGRAVEESLLQKYGESSPTQIPLLELSAMAPWIECLPASFVDYKSFQPLRKIPKYIEILTFTTPVFADSQDLAFLEVWEEDGRYSNMGTWWWMQMHRVDGAWKPDWQHVHAIS